LSHPRLQRMHRSAVICLIGDPGSGKSLFAKTVNQQFPESWISISDLLNGSGLLRSVQSSKRLVANSIMIPLTRNVLVERVERRCPIVVIDGYPRTKQQAKSLLEWGPTYRLSIQLVHLTYVHLDLPTAWSKISRRVFCSNCGFRCNLDILKVCHCPSCHVGELLPRDLTFTRWRCRVLQARRRTTNVLEKLRNTNLLITEHQIDPRVPAEVIELAEQYAATIV
jgi:adenylate kinase family enzyme